MSTGLQEAAHRPAALCTAAAEMAANPTLGASPRPDSPPCTPRPCATGSRGKDTLPQSDVPEDDTWDVAWMHIMHAARGAKEAGSPQQC